VITIVLKEKHQNKVFLQA